MKIKASNVCWQYLYSTIWQHAKHSQAYNYYQYATYTVTVLLKIEMSFSLKSLHAFLMGVNENLLRSNKGCYIIFTLMLYQHYAKELSAAVIYDASISALFFSFLRYSKHKTQICFSLFHGFSWWWNRNMFSFSHFFDFLLLYAEVSIRWNKSNRCCKICKRELVKLMHNVC